MAGRGETEHLADRYLVRPGGPARQVGPAPVEGEPGPAELRRRGRPTQLDHHPAPPQLVVPLGPVVDGAPGKPDRGLLDDGVELEVAPDARPDGQVDRPAPLDPRQRLPEPLGELVDLPRWPAGLEGPLRGPAVDQAGHVWD